ncbi:hypothetical protein BDZ94DRAFT_1266544 [Collybia nuda]|uniref:DUF6699 domain-containing protein n=1 Tax=Collybia nuda TaxID=64659 RepID=A0A9P5XYZ5_9AGAR|nr:hypothetical protein BDZ94DRAFT_1266544 [Collybia nuda]
MSGPYVYTPSTPLQYPNQQTPYFYTPRTSTPFIPDANLYNSPYSNPNSLPGTPHGRSAGIPVVSTPSSPGGVPFPGSGYDDPYAPSWENLMRQRRPSWHGTPAAPPGAFLQPQQQQPYPIYNRRHSFGAHGNPYQPPQYADWSQLQGGLLSPQSYFTQSYHVNPWINAEAPRGDFFFDLSSAAFLPLRLYGGGHSAPLSQDQLEEPATHPPLTRLRILCDLLPNWPIDLEFQGHVLGGYSPGYQPATPPPISLLDVLIAIHRALHTRIMHADWLQLNDVQQREVGRAYTRRCKAAGSTVDHELAQGVKKVDFLLKKTRMLGLLRAGHVDGWDVMRLVVTE